MSEGYLESNDLRVGYIKPFGRAYQPIVYAAVDGLAIFQGCIILGTVANMEGIAAQIKEEPLLLKDPTFQLMGVAIKGENFRWENKTIPYVIDPGFPNENRVNDAIKHWHERTAIRLVKRDATNPAHADYVRFRSVAGGCASAVGRQGGEQHIVLAPGCLTGNIIHEIGHTVGLWHEQSRSDRDNFIEIVWQNIATSARPNFEQHIDDGVDLGEYDYGSIMHYPAEAFPKTPGLITIKPRKAGVNIGQRTSLSAGDIAAVAKMYA